MTRPTRPADRFGVAGAAEAEAMVMPLAGVVAAVAGSLLVIAVWSSVTGR